MARQVRKLLCCIKCDGLAAGICHCKGITSEERSFRMRYRKFKYYISNTTNLKFVDAKQSRAGRNSYISAGKFVVLRSLYKWFPISLKTVHKVDNLTFPVVGRL